MSKPTQREERASREAYAWRARLQGELSASDRAEFDAWYKAHAANREAHDRIAADWADRYSLVARTHTGRSRVGLPDAPPRPFGYALAAAALTILLIGGVLLFRPGAEAAAEARIVSTRIGEIRTIDLPDETRVTLDTATRIDIRYGDAERRVEVQQGRARFAAASGGARPLIVEANGGRIVLDGTVFDVSLAPGGLLIAPVSGAVEVQIPSSGTRTLEPGERVLLHWEGQVQDLVPVSEAEIRWPAGMLEFSNMPLQQAVAEANRYSARKIRIGNPGTGRLRVTGTFRAGDTDGLARSLAAAFSLRVENGPSGDMILSQPASS
jgi:transmembrane sensor